MSNEPNGDGPEQPSDATRPGEQPAAAQEGELADQVERVVSLLHKLESLYVQSPAKSRAAADLLGGDRFPDELPDDFLDTHLSGTAGHDSGAARTPPPPSGGHLQTWQPPPIPGQLPMPQEPDQAFWYKGALRQHQKEVSGGSSILTRVGLGIAAVLALLLLVPWLAPNAVRPEWRQALARIVPKSDAPADAKTAVAGAGAGVAAGANPETAGAEDVAALPPAVRPNAEPDSSPAAETGGATAALTAEEGSTDDTEQDRLEDGWREAALDALFTQRAAWMAARESGEWTGIANTAPVDARTFGTWPEVVSPGPGGPGDGRIASLDGGALGSFVAGQTCDDAKVEADQTTVRLELSAPSRAGMVADVNVNDFRYRSRFDESGSLNLEAPRLDEVAVVRWVQTDGSVCQRTLERTQGPPMLQVALVWNSDIGLELEVVEPRSWVGNSVGYITAMQPNVDGSHGAGSIRSFGRAGDPGRAQVYTVPRDTIGGAGVLSAQVKLVPRAEGGGSCGSSAEVFTNSEVPYEVYIVEDAGAEGGFRRDTRAFAFNVPPCGASANQQRAERLTIKF